ncbi:hypothetical protein I3843_07G120900 [Carya illinoinensis]|nr:hypothetical protein I3843_07G120900 [Carya illinoinensis]
MSISDGDEGFSYWVRWQVPVCALVIGGPAFFAVKFVRKLKAEPLHYNDLWTPCWRNLNPLWLLIFRAFAFVCLAWVLYEIVSVAGAFAFYFYTQWTLALVMVYFVLGTVVSAYGCWFSFKKLPSSKVKGTANLKSRYAQEEIQGKLRFWGYLMQTVYQTCAGAVILTDVVFWCLLVPFLLGEQFSLTLLIGCLHSLNAIFLLLDTALNNLPFSWFGFAYFVIWSCLYVAFQWILHACGFTWWPYPFLELRTPWAPLWYFSLALVHIPCYGIYALIFRMKNSVLPVLFPRAFIARSRN